MTDRDRPVLTGLLALAAVAVVIGAVLGLATLAGTAMLGLGQDASPGAGPSQREVLYLPTPSPTERPTGPLLTLAPADGGSSPTGTKSSEQPRAEKKDRKKDRKKREQAKGISLSVTQQQVAPMERIDLTGAYRGGEGAILQVQRFEGGSWQDFPVTVSVSGGTFATYVQTGQPGKNRFRVVDPDTGRASRPVTVRVG